MSALGDGALLMYLHLYPQISKLNVFILTGLSCIPHLGWGRSYCAFLQTQIFENKG